MTVQCDATNPVFMRVWRCDGTFSDFYRTKQKILNIHIFLFAFIYIIFLARQPSLRHRISQKAIPFTNLQEFSWIHFRQSYRLEVSTIYSVEIYHRIYTVLLALPCCLSEPTPFLIPTAVSLFARSTLIPISCKMLMR